MIGDPEPFDDSAMAGLGLGLGLGLGDGLGLDLPVDRPESPASNTIGGGDEEAEVDFDYSFIVKKPKKSGSKIGSASPKGR